MTAMYARPRLAVRLVGLTIIVFSLAGCGADLASGALHSSSVTGYKDSSLFDPAGHKIAVLPDGRFRVTAAGSAETPKARVEKIAMARAAEYGAELHRSGFQTTQPVHSIRCDKRSYSEKGVRVEKPKVGYNVVEIDVTYSNSSSDPAFKPCKTTAKTLKAELQSEAVPPEVLSQTAAEVAAQCGR